MYHRGRFEFSVPSVLAATACIALMFHLQGCGGDESGGIDGPTTSTSATTISLTATTSAATSSSTASLTTTTSPTTTTSSPTTTTGRTKTSSTTTTTSPTTTTSRTKTTSTTTTTTRSTTTASTSSASTSPRVPPATGWTLDPIEVRGNHLYNSVTGKQFHAKGIGFPNVGAKADVAEWIRVLQRIRLLSKDINSIRIYEQPDCSMDFDSNCFEQFMREADKLGIYVLIAGSGTQWGWFPGQPSACNPPISKGLQGCYTAGGILGFGRQVIRKFNYPNTLAIVIANEIEQNIEALPVLKAYARDLKTQMDMCNNDKDSPTKGKMRQIPLMYAATDKGADFYGQADYLFCGQKDASIDIYGLNIERWVSDAGGKQQYDQVNKDVLAKQWPGAFTYSEEGGPYGGPYPKVRTWNQLPGFFAHWPAVDGIWSYTYFGGNAMFNMFDGPTADAKMLEDGKNYFDQMGQMGPDPADVAPSSGTTPECKTSLHMAGTNIPLVDYHSIEIYDTGKNGWAVNCPKPWQEAENPEVLVV